MFMCSGRKANCFFQDRIAESIPQVSEFAARDAAKPMFSAGDHTLASRVPRANNQSQKQIAMKSFRPSRCSPRNGRHRKLDPWASVDNTSRIPGCSTQALYHWELLVHGREQNKLPANFRPMAAAPDAEMRYRQPGGSGRKMDKPKAVLLEFIVD